MGCPRTWDHKDLGASKRISVLSEHPREGNHPQKEGRLTREG